MSKEIEFEYICAECPDTKKHMFRLNKDECDYDCDSHRTCIIWNNIVIYGVPVGFSEEEWEEDDQDAYNNAIKIGKIKGCLILCNQILSLGEEPLDICDDESADLEYTISSLSDENGPLNIETGEPFQDVYYIDDFTMEPEYDDPELKSRILQELPHIIFTLFHNTPELIAYYPSPLDYEPDPAIQTRKKALMNIAMQKLDSNYFVNDSENQEESKDSLFGKAYEFNDDEINIVMGRRNSTSSYPEEAKDKKEFALYEDNGFIEAGNSRLLYKHVNQF